MTEFERTTWNHMRIHVLPTTQFKTYAISAFLGIPLSEEKVTQTALTPFVLRRGTARLPNTIQIREKLDDLYGAGFGFDIYKKGDYQIVQFRLDMIQDQWIKYSGSLLEQSIQFLGELITKPLVEQGQFRESYVKAEKNTIQKRIEAIINDKTRYAAERCIQEMCKNEPYRLHPLGNIDDLPSLDGKTLFSYYQSWLQDAAIDIYVVGNTSLEEVEKLVSQYVDIQRTRAVDYEHKPPKTKVSQVRRVEERLDVSQGKLNMGLRLPITFADDAYPAALLYNGIFGGYPHSKLFMNVREKASLAYYASSRFDGHKGIMTIQTGIEIKNVDKTIQIIQEQLDLMRSGEISELEINQTKAILRSQLKEIQDSAFEMIAYDFNRVVSQRERSVTSMLEEMTQVDRQHIQRVAEQVQLDTIYFLRDLKGE